MQREWRRAAPIWAGVLVAAWVNWCQTAAAHQVALLEGAPAAAASEPGPWGADYFPNVPLTTQDGKRVRFFDDLIKGKVVAINFIYTRCPDSCPLETARLREVQQILGERVGRDVFFYSITIEPEHDTPAVLRQYAAKFNVGPGWLFLTGKEEDITQLRRKLGLLDVDEPSRLGEHSLSMLIGNQASGVWKKASPFENPYILATDLGGWLHNWKQASARKNDYANAPKLRQISRGEELFRTRCSTCHTIGAPQDSFTAMHRIGPDLAGVTRLRDRAWLARWLKEPDRMLAEKDPLAMELLARYNNVAMPNLRLSPKEIDALLGYLDEADRQPADDGKPIVRN